MSESPRYFWTARLCIGLCGLLACNNPRAPSNEGETSIGPGIDANTSPAVGAPSGLVAVGHAADVQLTWNASPGALMYRVLRSDAPGGPYVQAGAINITVYTDADLAAATTYYYVVQASSGSVLSSYSDEVSATTGAPAVPAPVTGLTATGHAGSIFLTWYHAPDAGSYAVLRSTVSGGPYSQVGATTHNIFGDTGLGSAVTYYYVVRAVNDAGSGGLSNEAVATTQTTAPPVKPSGLTAIGGYGFVRLSWNATHTATEYRILRADAQGGPYTDVGDTQAITFVDANLDYDRTYYYVVDALNTIGRSPDSDEVAAVTATPSGREVCVADASENRVAVFDPTQNGDGSPLRWFGDVANLRSPSDVAIDDEEIFVSNEASSSIGVYSRTATGNVAPARTIAGTLTKLSGPTHIVLDTTHGELIVVNRLPDSITVFASSASGNVAPLRVISGAATQLQWPWALAVDPVHDEILVTNQTGDAVTVYARTADGNVPPLRTISGTLTGITYPQGIAVDPGHGEVFVTNLRSYGVGSALLYFSRTASGNARPLRSISGTSSGLAYVGDISFDATNDELVILNQNASTGERSIDAFSRTAQGDVAPLRSIGWNSLVPQGVAVDAANDEVFVADAGGSSATASVVVLARTPSGDQTPLRQIWEIPTGLHEPIDIASDLVNGEIVVLNTAYNSLAAYAHDAARSAVPLRTVLLGASFVPGIYGADLQAVAVDPTNDEVFTAIGTDNAILVSGRTVTGTSALLRTIVGSATGLNGARAVVVDASHNEILVANAGDSSITVYQRTANLNATPIRTISGSATHLATPIGVALDLVHGEILVLNAPTYSPFMTVYARTATGNIAPLRIIAGASTELNGPVDLAVDVANNEILVANAGQKAVAVFARDADGNVPPLRTLVGPMTGLSQMTGIAVCQ